MSTSYLQDPGEVLDYSIVWTLAPGEVISESTWAVEEGDLEIGSGSYSPTSDDTSTTVWLQGGTVGTSAKVTNRITTDASPPRVMERSIYLLVRAR